MSYSIVQWRRQWHPTPVLLPGKSHGWRSLVGYSPWGCKELNMTEQLHWFTDTLYSNTYKLKKKKAINCEKNTLIIGKMI